MNRWRARLAELRGVQSGMRGGVQNVQIVQKPTRGPTFEHFEQSERRPALVSEAAAVWSDAQEERAAIIEFDASVPREWAEALARLDPAQPPAGVPPENWLRFINACGRFLDGG